MQNQAYHDQVPNKFTNLLQAMSMNVVLVGGAGGNEKFDGQDGSFAGRAIAKDAFDRAPETRVGHWMPSRSQQLCDRTKNTAFTDLHGIVVNNDFKSLVETSISQFGAGRTLMGISSATGTAPSLLKAGFDAGASYALVDKPGVLSLEQLFEIEQMLAGHEEREVYIFQNHRKAAAIMQIKHLVQDAICRGKKVKLKAGFFQPWLCADDSSKQALSRISSILCTLLDLGWHVFDLLEFVADSEALVLSNGQLYRDLINPDKQVPEQKHYNRDVITGGESSLTFVNSLVTATVECNQALPEARCDDIWLTATVTEDDGPKTYAFMMTRGGGDIVFQSKVQRPDRFNGAHWDEHETQGPFFADEVNAACCRVPGGHMPRSWSEMNLATVQEVIGSIARHRKLQLTTTALERGAAGDLMPAHMKQEAPRLLDVAGRCMRYVIGSYLSSEQNGAAITLRDIKSDIVF